MAVENTDFVFHQVSEFLKAIPKQGGGMQAGVTYSGIEVGELIQVFHLFRTVEVGFVENQDDGYPVGFG